jgi:DinB superfamily
MQWKSPEGELFNEPLFCESNSTSRLTGWSLHGQNVSTFIDEAKQSYADVSDNLLKSAQWMPEENYNFRPTPKSRTFGQLIGDAARSQADVCSTIDGNRLPVDREYSESKADLVEALEKSIRKCNSAYRSVNALNANQEVGFGSRRYSKLGLMFINVTHEHELYGSLAVYLRLNRILPPSEQARVVPID